MNFIELCLAGDALEEEIDDYIDKWHDGQDGKDQELHEYLGMTFDEYSIWATKPSILRFIIQARRNNTDFIEEINMQRLALAARASSAEEAKKIEVWLNLIDRKK